MNASLKRFIKSMKIIHFGRMKAPVSHFGQNIFEGFKVVSLGKVGL